MAKLITAKAHDIGGLHVKRVLPSAGQKMVGPFIFFDHMGPNQFKAGQGSNVRPHPHIGLSTLTYLFEGSILHRDSLGNHLEIFPGDVNWMTAGKGIVHSERETFEVRSQPHRINGLQCWIVLPEKYAELDPSFQHIKKESLPVYTYEDVMIRLIVGEAYGMSAPVKTYSPLFYLDIAAAAGSKVAIPNPEQQTAVYVIDGEVKVGEHTLSPGEFALLDDEQFIELAECGRAIMLGGDAFDTTPFIEWNFVSFNKARIEQAKADWKAGKFPVIPGDDKEFIPL